MSFRDPRLNEELRKEWRRFRRKLTQKRMARRIKSKGGEGSVHKIKNNTN